MKCHYEVLSIPRDASVDDIKKSYRKLALEWHPDKNPDRTEEATETFQLIQQAYEVLVDPQERAWYDRNRDKILRGDEEYKDDQLDVYQYFNTSRFKGYGDDEKSFYTVYREVFDKIIAEDKQFMDDDITIPGFGYSYSPYKEEVYTFYAYWQSYCTAKPYTWADKYDLVEARRCAVGRQVLRCMERENKKLREMCKKARNEEVRQLVGFVKKRDKRIEEYKKLAEKQYAEKIKKAEEHRRKQIAERKKHLEQYKETEWASMSSLESHLNEIEANLDCEFGAESSDKDDDSSASDVDDLFCIACDKAFRSSKAMTNHQKSKKHRENVASLKEYMEDEDVVMTNLSENCDNSQDESLGSLEKRDTCDEPEQSEPKKKKKKKRSVLLFPEEIDTDIEEYLNADTDGSSGQETCQESKLLEAKESVSGFSDFVENNEEYCAEPEATDLVSSDTNDEASNLQTDNCRENVEPRKKKNKKGAFKCNDEAATACVKCGKAFESRNKLFEHLKETGHSTFMTDKEKTTSKKKKKKA